MQDKKNDNGLDRKSISSLSEELLKKHDEVIQCENDNIIVFAGRQVGKDSLILKDIEENVTKGVVIVMNSGYQSSNIMAKIFSENGYKVNDKFLYKDKWDNDNVRILCDYQKTIISTILDNNSGPKIIDIDDVVAIYINEPSYVSIDKVKILQKIINTLREKEKKIRFLSIGTPRINASKIFMDILGKYDPYVFHIPCTDNEHINDKAIQELRESTTAMGYATEVLALPISTYSI